MPKLVALLLFSGILFGAGCSGPDEPPAPDPNAHLAGPDGSVDPPEYVIRQSRFFGLGPGMPLTAAGEKLIRLGPHYLIRGNDGDTIGYVIAAAPDSTLIGEIHVLTPRAATEGDIRVGDPFSRLLVAYPKLVVQRSAGSGAVFAYSSNKAFRLADFSDGRESVPAEEVPATTRVTEIVIRPGVRAVAAPPVF